MNIEEDDEDDQKRVDLTTLNHQQRDSRKRSNPSSPAEVDSDSDEDECDLPLQSAQQLLKIVQQYGDNNIPTNEADLQQFLDHIGATGHNTDTASDNYLYHNADLNTASIDPLVFDPWFHTSELSETHPLIGAWRHLRMIHTVTDRAWLAGLQRDTRDVIQALRSAIDHDALHVDIPLRVHKLYLTTLCDILVKVGTDTDVTPPTQFEEADNRSAQHIAELNALMATLTVREQQSTLRDQERKLVDTPPVARYAASTVPMPQMTPEQLHMQSVADQERVKRTLIAHLSAQAHAQQAGSMEEPTHTAME